MIRKRHRTNFIVSLLALGVPLILCSTAYAHVPSHYLLSGDSSVAASEAATAEREEDVHKMNIRTTAYTHTESDHLQYGRKSAAGTTLKSGAVTSAAADWSKFPIGTKFRIPGRDEVYEIDDYGSALIGKDVIDLYRPTRSKMDEWGARMVDIEVVEWGDFEKSLEILRPRAKKSLAVRRMIEGLEEREAEIADVSRRG